MKNNNLKVGDSAEVVVITKSAYPTLYRNNECGIVTSEFSSGNLSVIIGITSTDFDSSRWLVRKGTYKKIGRLTVTKVK